MYFLQFNGTQNFKWKDEFCHYLLTSMVMERLILLRMSCLELVPIYLSCLGERCYGVLRNFTQPSVVLGVSG